MLTDWHAARYLLWACAYTYLMPMPRQSALFATQPVSPAPINYAGQLALGSLTIHYV